MAGQGKLQSFVQPTQQPQQFPTAGKLIGKQAVAVPLASPPPPTAVVSAISHPVATLSLQAVVNDKSVSFLIDTGACVSLLPKSLISQPVLPTNCQLRSVNGSNITIFGETTTRVAIRKLRREYKWTFIVTDSTPAILGIDFLTHFKFNIDCHKKSVTDPTTSITMQATLQPSSLSFIRAEPDVPALVNDLLQSYPAVTDGHPPNSKPPVTTVQHRIDTGSASPCFCRPRPLYGEKLAAAKHEFQILLDSGVIRPSSSPWSSPLHMVAKKDPGSWRPCGDYRQLNTITVPDRYPIPHLQAATSRLSNATVFSKIDLERAYHQVPVHPDDIQKTAVSTPFGLFEYVAMPFGLRNAAQTFQRHMDSIFRQFPFVTVYLDDILIASVDERSHIKHLQQVFEQLSLHHLRLNLKKCSFLQSSVSFLGHHISASGVRPTEERTTAISSYPQPDTYASLRRFLGMVNFYRRFLPQFATTVAPLQSLIHIMVNKKDQIQWTDEAIASFCNVKDAIKSAVTLSPPTQNSPSYQLVTDASKEFVGAALHQTDSSGKPFPIGFFSKKLTATQQAYSTYDRELLAAYLAARHFQSYIEGANVLLLVDHKPIVSAFHSRQQSHSERQQRHLSFLTEICSDAQYIRGSDNVVADTLSRPVAAIKVDVFDLSSIAQQQTTADTSSFSEPLKPFPLPDGSSIQCDTTTDIPRPFLPITCRRRAFDELHNLSHPGVKSTTRLIKSRYVWPEMEKDIKQWVQECLPCQQSKITRHTKSPLQQFSVPHSSRFECVHMDLVGPLPPCKPVDSPDNFVGYRYLATFIDRATRWIEVYPLQSITASAVADAFLNAWVTRFGVPLILVTDQGRQFESDLFKCLSATLGFHRIRTTAYHPQSNGKIERAHRTIKTAIKSRKKQWLQSLPVVLMALRCIPNDSGISPFTAVTGSPIMIPPVAVSSSNTKELHEFTRTLAKRFEETTFDFSSPSQRQSSSYVNPKLSTASHVWLRTDRVLRPLEAPYSGPYPVLSKSTKVFKIQLPSGSTESVSIDRLKPATLPRPTQSPTAETTPEKTLPDAPQPQEKILRSRRVRFDI